MDVDLYAAQGQLVVTRHKAVEAERTDLALREEELDAFPSLRMCNSIVLSLLVVTHGVEAPDWRR